MKNTNPYILAGCIQEIEKVSKVRFFYLNLDEVRSADVTHNLYLAIQSHNKTAAPKSVIPFAYEDGFIEHVSYYPPSPGPLLNFREELFPALAAAALENSGFPLTQCRLEMFTPLDIRHELRSRDIFEDVFEAKLLAFFVKQTLPPKKEQSQ